MRSQTQSGFSSARSIPIPLKTSTAAARIMLMSSLVARSLRSSSSPAAFTANRRASCGHPDASRYRANASTARARSQMASSSGRGRDVDLSTRFKRGAEPKEHA
jgi:hypothetical protein